MAYCRGLLFLLLTAAAVSAGAAELSIVPLRLDLSAGRDIAALTLTNRGAQPVIMQLSLRRWTMVDGEDVYAPTEDLIATPPVFEVQAGEKQVIRVGYRGNPPAEHELAYRLFLEQVPPDAELGEDRAVRVTLRFGVPVFVQPELPVNHAMEWDLESAGTDQVRLLARNVGNTHYRLTRLRLSTPDGSSIAETEGVFYLLPGSRREWALTKLRPTTPGTYRLTAENSTETVAAELHLR